MKKILRIGACILGILFIILGGIMKIKENTALSIIGGADGPTAVFIAGKLNSKFTYLPIVIGIVLLVITAITYVKRK